MRLLACFTTVAAVGVLLAAPADDADKDKVKDKEDDQPLEISLNFYKDEFVVYKSKHDIVSILTPLNSLNFDESEESSESEEEDTDVIIFFVEADEQPDGTRDYKGLYILKKGNATQILPNGRDAAASGDDSKLVFLGATDGIYVYNGTTDSVEKYGSITDSIIGIAAEKLGSVLYILTEDHEVYKVTEEGEKKEKLEDVEDAKEIVLDYSDNLYFFSDNSRPFVRTENGVKAIKGLPGDLDYVKLVRPPFILDDSVPFVVNNQLYILYANGTSEEVDISFRPKTKPTAYSPEAALIQYYSYNKKIYEFNILNLLLGSLVEELSSYLSSKESTIKSLATKTKSQAVQVKVTPH